MELNYQVLAFGHAEDLFSDADDPYVAAFQALNTGAAQRFETVSRASQLFNF